MGIVTDSMGELPIELKKKYSIIVVPGDIYIDGERYKSGENFFTKDLSKIITEKNKTFRTGAPPPGEYYNAYSSLIDDVDFIISLHPPRKQTSAINSANTAIQRMKDPSRIKLFETGVATLGLGLVVIATAISAQQIGDESELLSQVQKYCQQIQVIGTLDSLKYVNKTGRISIKIATMMADALSIKPILIMRNSDIFLVDRPRKREKALDIMVNLLSKSIDTNIKPNIVGISDFLCKEDSKLMKQEINKYFPQYQIIEGDADPMIAANTGPGLLLIAYFALPNKDIGGRKINF
ncbi:DegV family protein [Candidatus Hodarchaeum mangrovi]